MAQLIKCTRFMAELLQLLPAACCLLRGCRGRGRDRCRGRQAEAGLGVA